MSKLISPEDVDAHNERSLSTLVRAIALSQGQFSLILVRCNYTRLRERALAQLRQCAEIRELVFPESAKTLLYAKIEAEVWDENLSALMVLGLESVTAIDDLLTSANQVRDKFRQNFSFPLVLWVNDQVLQKLVKLARDFHSWAGAPIQLAIAPEELSQWLRQEADLIFTKVLAAGADQFLDNAALNLGVSAGKRFEIESACQELQSCGRLEPALAASQQFLLGRDAYAHNQMERSRQLYEQSLAFWQQSQDLERQACVLFHLGLWWRRYAVLYRSEHQTACERAREYYQQCVEVLQQANCPELVCQFINSLAEVLQQLEQWEQLETVAKASVKLHQIYPDPFKLANAYGYLAEVALAKSAWNETKQYAETALTTIAQLSEPDRVQNQDTDLGWLKHHQSWYRLLLAKAQQHLAQKPVAIQSLETAKAECKPEYHPPLYLRILEALRSLYFEQHHYLEAFEIKQHQGSIEQQYGFRAFLGAGRLQSERQIINPALVLSRDDEAQLTAPGQQQASVALEIAASGRQQDVNRLIERISRDDYKLIVLYGQSGVGKSSIVQAGLVPALKLQAIGERDALPVLLQVYTDWARELGRLLAAGLEEVRGVKTPNLASPTTADAALIGQLKRNADRNLLTVLIFDQFEEFFFVYKDQAKRRPFYDFLQSCLEIPYVKVILSLREDYLHYLLQCERVTDLRAIDCNILDKKILYYLGNFSPEDAKSVIRHLTERSQFPLESALIDELVKDLAGELGEVRPIELQVVGAQLQAEQITTLAEYQLRGPKEKLVERFLEEVVKDCGAENERAAQLVLYLLTDENNTRPLKTRAELAADLAAEADKIDLVLEILRKSGLVFLLPQFPADLYQLVHDYLVAFIRQQRGAELIAELEKEREQRKRSEAELNRVLKRQLRVAIAGGSVMAVLAVLAGVFGLKATIGQTNAQLNAHSLSSESLFASDKQLEALIESLRAGKTLKQSFGAEPDAQLRVVTALDQAVYTVRERNRLEGHTDSVTSVSFSPDGKIIASGSQDKRVRLWSSEGKLLRTLDGYQDGVTSVSFSRDGKMIASSSKDGVVKLWSRDGQEIKTWKGHNGSVTNVRFSPDGKMLASTSDDNTVKLWRIDGTLLQTFKHNGSVTNASFSSDGKMLASTSDDNTVKLWRIDGTLLKIFWGHKNGVTDVRFNSDGTITSASKDNTVNIWNHDGTLRKTIGTFGTTGVISFSPDGKIASASKYGGIKILSRDGTRLYNFPIDGEAVTSLSFSPDGKMLASASKDNTVRFWNLDSPQFTIRKGYNSIAKSISFSHDSQTIALTSNDNTMRLWNRDGTLLKTIKGYSAGVSFSPDDKTLVSAGVDDVVKLWRSDGTLLKTLPGHSSHINSVSFSPDGKTIASASDDNTVKLWRSDGTLLTTLKGHNDRVTSVSFSPDGKVLASVSADNTIILWRSDGSLLKTLKQQSDGFNKISFSPNGEVLALFGQYDTVELLRSDGTLLTYLKGLPNQGHPNLRQGHTNNVTSVSFSPDSQTVASASEDNTVKLWKLDGTLLTTLQGHSDRVTSVSFSPDDQTIASGSYDNTVRLWKLDGTLLTILQGHTGFVNSVSFSPDGKTIASGSYDNTVKLWRPDGTLIATLQGHSKSVKHVSFSSDGQTIVSASDDNTVKLWKPDGTLWKTLPGHSSDVSISQDGKMLATASTNDAVKLWQRDGTLLNTLPGHRDSITSVTFSPDGNTIASASDDKTVKLWRRDGTLLKTLEGHSGVKHVSFSPNGQMIASASADKTIQRWNLDGKELPHFNAHSSGVNSVIFSPDGKQLASASDDQTVILWSLDGKKLQTFKGHSDKVTSIGFSHDGKVLASADSYNVKLWSLDGTLLKTFQYIGGQDVSFSPDGQMIAAAGNYTTPDSVWSLDLDKLMVRGCDQVRDYLKNNLNVSESDRTLCDGIGTQKQ